MVKKTALGAEGTVSWAHVMDPIECLEQLRRKGACIVGLELTDVSTDLADYHPRFPLALVLGNEVEGLTAMQLARCDDVISIRQQGKKESMNVGVAAGIAAWKLLNDGTT